MTATDELATADEVAAFLRTGRQQLSNWRYNGRGPRYVKLGRRVLYRWADVYAWLEENTKTRTDDVARVV